MEFVEERVAARFQRMDHDEGGHARRQHLLDAQRRALEFGRSAAGVVHDDLEALAGRYLQGRRFEMAIADGQLIRRQGGLDRAGEPGQQRQDAEQRAPGAAHQ
ncbi:hypothetical protein BAY1663_01496 [Pseudomonas sp. BAY1663]|nr:hypothetical protein BAY1663_01496 [Pseudomonas sp. BAY1663]